jgi:photosystem II stability/assembly factor-like uncharacterized protein
MAKNKLIIFLLIIFNSYCLSQTGWIQQNSGTTQELFSVFFINPNTGYITGNSVLKTTNGGLNWFVLNSAPSSSSVFFTDVSTGYLGSSRIYKTTNEGASWSIVSPQSTGALALFFINAATGWAAYNNMYRTTDGGASWIISSSFPGYSFVDIRFSDGNTGFAVWMYGSYTKSTDGGANWSSLVNPGNVGWFSVFPVDNNLVFLSGNGGRIGKSTDGGANWTIQNSAVSYNLFSSYFINANTGYIVGERQSILKTSNGGANWYTQTGVNLNRLNKVFFVNADTGWVVGQNGTILKTTTGGVLTAINPVISNIPDEFILYQNYPNPFNPVTEIKFSLPKASSVRLIVYDAIGREISVLLDKYFTVGNYEAEWSGTDYSNGVYFYKIITPDFTDMKKMVLLK